MRSNAEPAPTLILGLGNPLRRDDGVGAVVAAGLTHCTGLRAEALFQLTPEWAEPISMAGRVYFIDARVCDPAAEVPGAVAFSAIEPMEANPRPALTHHCTPSALLLAARTWYGRMPHGFLITVAAADFAHGEGLSAPVRQAADRLITFFRHKYADKCL